MLFNQLSGTLPGETNNNPTVRQVVMNEILATAPILRFAEFYTITGNADAPRKAVSATGGQVRALNDEYPENKIDPSYGSINLVIFGDPVQTDIANHRRGADVASVHLSNLRSFARNMGKNLQYGIFNSTDWTGLMGAVPSSCVSSFSSDLSTDAKVKKLAMAIAAATAGITGGAQFIAMDQTVLAKLTTTAMGMVTYAPTPFGAYIPQINGVPIVLGGSNSAGAKTLPTNTGTGNNATKVVVGRFGEQSEIALATSVGLVVKDLGIVGTAYSTLVEMDIDLEILDNGAVAVIDEIQNPGL